MGRMRYPSLSLHGIEGAFSAPGAKTVIPAKVRRFRPRPAYFTQNNGHSPDKGCREILRSACTKHDSGQCRSSGHHVLASRVR